MTSTEPSSSAAPKRQPDGDKRSPRRVTTVIDADDSTAVIAESRSSVQPMCDSNESRSADNSEGAPFAPRTWERTELMPFGKEAELVRDNPSAKTAPLWSTA
ncbi:unannotated protein [freshwater metagenome]|uniref:Unannotated protein n=1 Tax=freshwater metagenome TaxID=449393 RepID=A0A6J6I2D7_9ZZZZ